MVETMVQYLHDLEAMLAPHGEWLAIAGLVFAILMLRRGSRARSQRLD